MCATSAESIAITTPLSVVAELFARGISSNSGSQQGSNSSENFYTQVRDHFSSILADHVDTVSRKITDLQRRVK